MSRDPMDAAYRAHAVAVALAEYTTKRRDGLFMLKSAEELAVIDQLASLLAELTEHTVDAVLSTEPAKLGGAA